MSRDPRSAKHALEAFARDHGAQVRSAWMLPSVIEIPHRCWTIKIGFWPGMRRSAPRLSLRVPVMPKRARQLSFSIQHRSIFSGLFGRRAVDLADPILDKKFHITDDDPEMVRRLFEKSPIGKVIQNPLFSGLRLHSGLDDAFGVKLPPTVQQFLSVSLLKQVRPYDDILPAFFPIPPIGEQLTEALPFHLALGRVLLDGFAAEGLLQERNPERLIRPIHVF